MKAEAEAAIETTKGLLQDLVVVVSLVHTLTDSFGSARDLYHKLKRKTHLKDSDDEDDSSNSFRRPLHKRHDSAFGPGRRKEDCSDSEEELIRTSSSHIRAEYERGYRKLGEPFARGDLTAQTQLQSQIIQLQQTLLNIQQDLLLSTYLAPSSSHSHLVRLIQTTRTARAASIAALNMQYQRMLPAVPPRRSDPPLTITGAFPLPVDRKHKWRRRRRSVSSSSSSSCSSDEKGPEPEPKPKPKPKPTPTPAPQPHHPRLFCIYASDLQHDSCLPLTDAYKACGNNLCPFCRTYIATQPGKAWEIITDDCKNEDGHQKRKSRTFLVKNRFVVKCHREHGGFACVLCARFKASDTVCREIGALMDHLWREHTGDELGKDDDIVEC
ncbi:hypothetical protein BDW02DRAFT_361449 [Decorospora gaudefroyi]|uniref:Uncharacterized protein n=1 Tax=Decorospora gaudefroyi TaxID=184978 RepID=A0A6A5K924_9PLEO|nr:hypothetical protein BDW02DRAFT_361449 [Decorospora gaudefroyi]